jgi:2-oxoglutarate dehydrogenase E2 component (dihydrolipoamide succinyltransferase)
MAVELRVPSVGESITEALLVEWLKQPGDLLGVDEPLFTLETDKVTLTVNAPAAGRLSILAEPGKRVQIGQVVGFIDTEVARLPPPARPGAPPATSALAHRDSGARGSEAEVVSAPRAGPPISAPAGQAQVAVKASNSAVLSAAARQTLGELTGDSSRHGQVSTPEEQQTEAAASRQGVPRAEPAPSSSAHPSPAPSSSAHPSPAPRQTRTPLSPLRQRIAERLVQAKNEAALVTTFNEADMTNVMTLRVQHREAFKSRHGVDLGFMSFFVKAAVDALEAVPELARQIQGDELVQNHAFDIGVAVSSEHGLVVPVVCQADQKSLAEIEKAILELASRVRDRSITLAELSGGVFTISNGGVFGSLLSTPIVNPPQAGILGMHAIKKRPVAVDDQITIRPMMYLALSYDHRIVDGREAVSFLRRVVSFVENPGFTLLGI